MGEQYNQSSQELIDKLILSKNYIYYYDQDELNEIFDLYFLWANEHLQRKQAELQFPSSYIVFNHDESTNATAFSQPQFKLISFNKGAIKNMSDFFEHQASKLSTPRFEAITDFEKIIGNPSHITLFQFYSIFFYYHEYAHLVQRSPTASFQINEAVNNPIPHNDVLDAHSRELDADWVAASNLAIHVAQYLTDKSGEFTGTVEQVADLVSMAIAAVYCYFLKAAGYYQEMYFMEHQHPHPYIRISYITDFVLKTMAPNLPDEVEIDQRQVIENAISLADVLLQADLGNSVMTFGQAIMQHGDEIENHVNEIMGYAGHQPFLCRNREPNSF